MSSPKACLSDGAVKMRRTLTAAGTGEGKRRPAAYGVRGAALRREPRARNEQPMQLTVFHCRFGNNTEDGPFIESLRVDVVRCFERSIGDLARDDFLLIQNLNPACAVAAERETIIRNRDVIDEAYNRQRGQSPLGT